MARGCCFGCCYDTVVRGMYEKILGRELSPGFWGPSNPEYIDGFVMSLFFFVTLALVLFKKRFKDRDKTNKRKELIIHWEKKIDYKFINNDFTPSCQTIIDWYKNILVNDKNMEVKYENKKFSD